MLLFMFCSVNYVKNVLASKQNYLTEALQKYLCSDLMEYQKQFESR